MPYTAACLGIALYSLMDALMKGLALAIGAYSALFWRLAVGMLFTASAWLAIRAPWPSPRVMRIHASRGIVVAAMALALFWGIARVTLAEAIALSFIAPIIALVLAAAVLKERIAPRAIAAAVSGIGGVGIILAGQLGHAHPPDEGWGAAAVLVLSRANARAEAQLLVSAEYTAFVWAAIMGWLVFGEPLRATTVAGAALIIAGCLIAARGGGAPAPPEAEALG